MKGKNRWKLGFCWVLLGLLGMTSCEIDSTNNREIDGYWHLTAMDSISGGYTQDLSKEKLFWAIEGKLFNVSNLYLMTELKGDTLRLYKPYTETWTADSIRNFVKSYRKYGINSLDERFLIENLSGKHLTVRDSILRIHFERY